MRVGCANLQTHAENVQKYGIPVVIAINRFPTDTPAELDAVKEFCASIGVDCALSEVVARGGDGGIELAKKVKALADNSVGERVSLYDLKDPIKTRIETLAREVYRADGVDFTPEAEAAITRLEQNDLSEWPICMAKTQSSLSDDPKKRNAPRGWRLQVREVKVSNGAGFIIAVTGKMMLMPGMPKQSAVNLIDIDESGRITGLS